MNLIPNNTAGKIIISLIAIVIILAVKFISEHNKWSPIDEYAHMDYVNKITEGRLPKLSDQISDEMFLHIKNNPEYSLHLNIHSREQLGIAGISYEAIHPPLYYIILSIPNKFMEIINIEIFARVKILRLFSYLFFVLGMFMILPCFKLLTNLGFVIPPSYALGCVLFGLITATEERYGLSDNMLSPLMINITLFYLLKYYIQPANKTMYLFFLFSCLSIFTALSNLFIIPVLYLFFLKKYITNFSYKTFFTSFLIITLFITLLILWKTVTKPDPTINDSFQALLTNFIPAGMIHYKIFMELFLFNAFTLSFINHDFHIVHFIIFLFIISNTICLAFFKNIFKKHIWILFTGVLAAIFFISTFLANKYIATIHWMAYRHYLGFIPVFYVSCTGFIVVLYSRYFASKSVEG